MQFGNDIGTEVGDRVRSLVLSLVVSIGCFKKKRVKFTVLKIFVEFKFKHRRVPSFAARRNEFPVATVCVAVP